MGCEHSSEPNEIAAFYEDENSLTIIDKYKNKTGGQITVHTKTRIRSEDSSFNGLFRRTKPNKIYFSKSAEFRAYIPGWAFFIKTVILKIGTFSPFHFYLYGYCQGKWILILNHEQKDRGTTINCSIFTAKSMKEGSLNKLYSAIGVRMYAPDQDKFCVEQLYFFGQALNRACRISPEVLATPMGHLDESTDEGNESYGQGNEKKPIEVCDKCRLTCIACKDDIDIVNPGKRGYICSSCYKREYKHICFICGSEMTHKNIGRLCQKCSEQSVGITECAQCHTEFPIS